MRNRILLSILAISFLLPLVASAGGIDDNEKVPFNSEIKTGKLKNDVPFFIMQNPKPKNRVELILVINAGAVLEDDDQNGLAHFCEHMAFNGTKSFPKQALVNFLESTGIRFGADLNAYTNQDETVYMLTLPDTDAPMLINGVKVIRDWAGYVTHADVDIEEERGVIMEEWRLGQGAEDRIQQAHAPYLYHGSKYAVRDVIGDTNVLRNAPPENVRRFYNTWYRPENMAVIAVGDVEPASMYEILYKYFSLPTEAGGQTSTRPQITLPAHDETLVSIASDKELLRARVEMYVKRPADTAVTYADYRRQITGRLASSMIRARLAELAQKAKPPFSSALVADFRITRETNALYARANAADKNVFEVVQCSID